MADVISKQFTPYQPKPDEQYMSKAQLNHFRKILNDWKSELSHDLDNTIHTMQDEVTMLKRMEARPTATLCIDCKTLDEMREKQVAK